LDMKLARQRYDEQRANAARRCIEWKFTFASWVLFWGDDLEKRGVHSDQLGMQRFHDKGPYSPENCTKDVPARNAKTRGSCQRAQHSLERKAEYQAQLDQAPINHDGPRGDLSEDELELARMFNPRRSLLWDKAY
jgi:hypothetical protein